MDLGPHVSFLQMCAKGAPFATPMRKHDSRTLTRFDNCSVELLKELLSGINGGLQQVRDECADSQGFEARVAGLSGVRGWRQSRHELVWRHEASSDAHRHTELKDQVQELGSRDVNLDAAIDFTATIRCQCSTGTQKSSTPFRPRCD